MENVHRKIAYIEGLIEGSDVDVSRKEGKVIIEMLQLMKEMAEALENVKMQMMDQEEYIEAIDDDLADLEEIVFEEDELDDDEEYVDGDDEDYYEIECPHCHEEVLVDEEVFDSNHEEKLICPECKQSFTIHEIQPVITKHVMDIENNKGELHYYT